jgi:hypothetical protein
MTVWMGARVPGIVAAESVTSGATAAVARLVPSDDPGPWG